MEEIINPINELIYYGFFYKQDGPYLDEMMEELKLQIEEELNKRIEWEDIKYQGLESDLSNNIYDTYYTDKELINILKTIELNSSDIEDIKITLDIEEHKKRVIKFFMNNELYTEYLKIKC